MSVLYVVLPLALLVIAGAVLAFVWSARSGQYDDMDTPAVRILHDEEERRTPPEPTRLYHLPSQTMAPTPPPSPSSNRSSGAAAPAPAANRTPATEVSAAPPSRASAYKGHERRNNPHLRELVDEMMASIRVAANSDLWSPEERERCENDLARIMASVRAKALEKHFKS